MYRVTCEFRIQRPHVLSFVQTKQKKKQNDKWQKNKIITAMHSLNNNYYLLIKYEIKCFAEWGYCIYTYIYTNTYLPNTEYLRPRSNTMFNCPNPPIGLFGYFQFISDKFSICFQFNVVYGRRAGRGSCGENFFFHFFSSLSSFPSPPPLSLSMEKSKNGIIFLSK